jgi:EAL domain-containing protein (putative c-di-GMP-specific phosphodiesterase class I)/CheY-like chemotaxis protein
MTDGRAEVLVVDDDDAVRSAVVQTLTRAGFEALGAANAETALGLLAAGERTFDLMITDLLMPGTSGVQLMRSVRESELDLPVIVLTGHPSFDSAVLALEYGGFRYLEKTVDGATLVNAVNEVLALHRPAALRKRALRQYDAELAAQSERSGLSSQFDRALSRMWIAFQPIVRWPEQSIFGYEALVRSSETGLCTPDLLIDAAERLGRVQELGILVREKIARNLACAPADALLFVNLHALDLTAEDLFSPNAALSAHASRVVLEVTERASLHKVMDLRARLGELRRLSFRIAVDDLGAGYAGLASFSQLEPEVVKFDMSLIRGIDKSPRKASIVRSMVAMCTQELGTTVVCEGVETEGERDKLSELGAELLQGYLFAEPAPGFRGRSIFARPLVSVIPDPASRADETGT